MSKLSDLIEEFIKRSIQDTGGTVEIKRNELAVKFNCVPSQINYVIDTRFTSNFGYYVESRRGGGGHIKITRAVVDSASNYLMHIIAAIGNSITMLEVDAFINNMSDHGFLSEREAFIIKGATNDKALILVDQLDRDRLRASIFKSVLISLSL